MTLATERGSGELRHNDGGSDTLAAGQQLEHEGLRIDVKLSLAPVPCHAQKLFRRKVDVAEDEQQGGDAIIVVAVSPHWVNALILRSFARPFLVIDDRECALSWGAAKPLPVAPGVHHLEVFFRYRAISTPVGVVARDVPVETSRQVRVDVKAHWLNHMPLQLSIAAPPTSSLPQDGSSGSARRDVPP